MDETRAQDTPDTPDAPDTPDTPAAPAAPDTSDVTDYGERTLELDELYGKWLLDAVNAVRRSLAMTSHARQQRQFDATELKIAATGAAEEGRQATANGDAQAAGAALERQRDVLERVEAVSVELRVLIDFEEKLRRHAAALDAVITEFRTAKESAKGELALLLAQHAFDLGDSDATGGGVPVEGDAHAAGSPDSGDEPAGQLAEADKPSADSG
ncbi:MAG: hypothetical protein ACRDVE_21470 [Actinocrinis sp.]